jgi:hypothetical protein
MAQAIRPPRRGAKHSGSRRVDPVDARCFATERYSVGDRGLRPIGEPDARLVEAFLSGPEAGSGDVVLERYLALKERSVRAVSAAQPADLDSALLAYVGTRKTMLMVVHRFFGEAGLRLIRTLTTAPPTARSWAGFASACMTARRRCGRKASSQGRWRC